MDPRLIAEAAARLRAAQSRLPSQHEIADSLAEWARAWRDSAFPPRRAAEAIQDPFPFAMAQISLDALLDSLTPSALAGLIAREGVSGQDGFPLIGHVIAGNTPLLAWASVLRALLVRSASLVKLPSGPAGQWGTLLKASLDAVAPALGAAVECCAWGRSAEASTRALCESADAVMAYGGDASLAAIQSLCPPGRRMIGYGHRVSFAAVGPDSDQDAAASGLARDVLLYDQGGCLSPQCVFVIGSGGEAKTFATRLAEALARETPRWPLPFRDPAAAGRVQEARALARMEGADVLGSPDLRWTVVRRTDPRFFGSPTYGVISVVPLAAWDDLPMALTPVRGRLQGAALTGDAPDGLLESCGVPYVCRPGGMQAPPFGWREDGLPPLRILVPSLDFS